MDVLGSSDGNGGGQAAHSFLWGPCGAKREMEGEREPVTVQNVFSLLRINLSENKFSHSVASASTQVASLRQCSHGTREGR